MLYPKFLILGYFYKLILLQEERPLPEECFDQITSKLASESPSTCQCVFFSQMGKGRSTLGTVIASIVKVAKNSQKDS